MVRAWAAVLEEDIALTNRALDLIGQARNYLQYAGTVEGKGRTEDDLAYLRNERQFVNVQAGRAAQRRLCTHDRAQLPLRCLAPALAAGVEQSKDEQLAAIAAQGGEGSDLPPAAPARTG